MKVQKYESPPYPRNKRSVESYQEGRSKTSKGLSDMVKKLREKCVVEEHSKRMQTQIQKGG